MLLWLGDCGMTVTWPDFIKFASPSPDSYKTSYALAGHLLHNDIDIEEGKQPLVEQLVEEVEVHVSNVVLWSRECLPRKLG